MKQSVLTLICLLFAFSLCAGDITSISSAFKEGNAASLAASMDQEVDIAVPGTSKKGNGKDAIAVLSIFFGSNRPTGFSVVHHADKEDNGFFVAKLPTSTGEYRVNVTYRVEGEKVLIQSIRIE
ncbi:MAG: DUF4783 domain-containing protein [Tannerellaceae bacterium]|nr:DUF4783 domain-containing protein [Tannerellaceae bacterium]